MKILQNTDNKKFAKIWVDDLSQVESVALDQIRLMLEMPNLFKHIAVMPDTHLGKGAVVGGVVATKGSIVPNIVGVDIGCGMSAINTGVKLTEDMNRLFWMKFKGNVDRSIPVGFNSHKVPIKMNEELQKELHAEQLNMICKNKAPYQLGTLGGGNHFLEAQVDQDNNIWFMVHSGSRNIGLSIASYYNKKAKELNERYHSKVPPELWFLLLDDENGQNYLKDMKWAINYALENRWIMLENLVSSFFQVLTPNIGVHMIVREVGINIHHNFASIENHFGENVVVHRKGATQARVNQIGIIPGSMGTNSYIIKGKGVEDSFTSCSHGAGRRMSRTRAKKEIDTNRFHDSIKGTYSKASQDFLDEAPDAYKDIHEVIRQQEDLVQITHTLRPIITIKGGGRDMG